MSDGCLEGVWPHSPQRLLRDMLWLLATPDLVALAEHLAGRPTPAELGLASAAQHHAWLARHADHFRQDESSAVPRQTAARPTRRVPPQRMGHYHERLWHLLLDSAPNTHLLGHNVRITQRRLTLGELDILYRTRQNPAPMHLEVAIKFYLGLPEGPGEQTSQSRWVGPGGLDSLALKCQHLRHLRDTCCATGSPPATAAKPCPPCSPEWPCPASCSTRGTQRCHRRTGQRLTTGAGCGATGRIGQHWQRATPTHPAWPGWKSLTGWRRRCRKPSMHWRYKRPA